ncbi:MAG: hypothetical protein MUQ32_10670 [Chloroflexi bacterium]|nr:hypothetical protein [Chloroflexota bacterium]
MRVPAIALIALIGLALLIGGCSGAGGGGGSGGEDAATLVTGTATGAPAVEPTDDGGGGSTGGGSGLDLCSLISAADVEAILGEPADGPVDDSYADLWACSWTGTVSPTELLTISVYVHPDADTAREQYAHKTEDLGGEAVPDLGDEASNSDGYGLQVLSGRYDMSILNTGDDRKALGIGLAQQIMSQLP